MKKKEIPVMNVGISLLILVFMTLALLIFSVLSLENAVADRRLSQKAADHTTAYYATASRIQEKMMAYMQTAEEDNWKVGTSFSFEEEVADGQMLVISVILEEEEGQKKWEVTQWQLQSSDDWEADRALNVYQGE